MPPSAAHPGRLTRYARPAAPLATVVLVGAGAGLVGAGALLSWRFGSAVSLGDGVLGVLSWCFQ